MNVETQIRLDKFKPRDFQLPFCLALENKGYKKLLAIMPRRAGKDIMCWNLMIRQACRKVGVYFYCLPTYRQANLVIWSSITSGDADNPGIKFLDFIPKELIAATNSQEMKITLINGSIIRLLGSDSYDSIVGSNPRMIVMSEYALCDPRALAFFRPILNANGGTMLIVSTPRGKNHLYELAQIAEHNPDVWFYTKLTLEDTRHISWEEIQAEIKSGEISEDLAMQEYFCSFDMGVEGAYYIKYIDKMRLNGQIGQVPWEPAFKVETAWDIGVRDSTVIIFFQRVGQTIRIIDYYEKSKEGLEHYAKILSNKPYDYSKHWAPHDIAVKEFGSGLSRLEKARQLGIKFESRDSGTRSALPQISIEDGIEACRSAFAKMWVDEVRCASLLKSLENYRQEFDNKRKVYRDQPLHDHNSHAADAFRYLVLSLSRTKDGQTTADELEKRYMKTVQGQQELPGFFRDDQGYL